MYTCFFLRACCCVVPQIERVKYYTEVPTEAAFDQNDAKSRSTTLSVPDQSWPSRGKIEFDWCCARYRPGLPLVIEDVTFTVEPEEKVGVVGRTGSGKSTLMQLLFRIIELHSGSIKFDGVDIANVGLRQLRTAIAILPQGAGSHFSFSFLFFFVDRSCVF